MNNMKLTTNLILCPSSIPNFVSITFLCLIVLIVGRMGRGGGQIANFGKETLQVHLIIIRE